MMRYAAGVFVADDPQVWRWAIGAIEEHVLAAEDHLWGRRVKAGLFRVFQWPMWRKLLPLRPLDGVELLATEEGQTDIDLAFRRSHGKWISFRRKEGVIRRHFPTRWRWKKERWIRSQPAVAVTSPKILGWDEARLISEEEYIPGRPVKVHDLDEGLRGWFTLWPLLGKVFATRVVMKPLRLPGWVNRSGGQDWLRRIGLNAVLEELGETPVPHGLVHGDLQQTNMIVHDDRFYVIDWGDHFHLAPPLYDLLFYLFKHSRSVGARRVVQAALDDPQWIEDGFPNALEPLSVKASLVAFTLMLTRRYQFRSLKRRRRLISDVQPFVQEVASRLLPSPDPYVHLPSVLVDLPTLRQ